MPHRVFVYGYAVLFACDAAKCLFTNADQAVVAQHEHDAHGPGWMAATTAAVNPTIEGRLMPTKIPHETLMFVYRCTHDECEFSDRYCDVVADHERDAHARQSPSLPNHTRARREFRTK
ncbi:hypothetical protein BJ970_002275 [Saccharopolyspora phatthalungensis]|uniref:Uncharacterized protein n=1 Tax=Saccharopolyspora phatthalungensis TaxID=664693 RepID=A0A840Q4Z0_9PSEU|nr:hypothetical protein [Saccharopolyspora phatthalungensis]